MKIAILVSSNIVKDPRILKQARTIVEAKDEVLVIGRKDSFSTEEKLARLQFPYQLIDIQNNKRSIALKIIERMKFGFKLYKNTIKYKPDIIHSNDFDTLLFAVLAGKRVNAKIIYDAHEIYSKNGNVSKIPLLSFLISKVEKKLMKNVTSFVTVSNAAKEYYRQKGYPLEAQVITNVPYRPEKLSKEKFQDFTVTYQGIISRDRGYEEFLNSAKFVDERINLSIRGYGDLKEKLLSRKNEEKYENVYFQEPVEISDMVYVASKAHVGVVLTKPVSDNYKYTVSNKIFEYIHAGIPVILSSVDEHIFLNEKYNFGILLEEVTPQSIAQAINKIYADKKLYEMLKENAYKAAHELKWEIEGQKFSQLYKRAYLVR